MIQAPEIKMPSFAGKEKITSGFSGVRKMKQAQPKFNFQSDQPQPGAQAGTLNGSMGPSKAQAFNPLKLGKVLQ